MLWLIVFSVVVDGCCECVLGLVVDYWGVVIYGSVVGFVLD